VVVCAGETREPCPRGFGGCAHHWWVSVVVGRSRRLENECGRDSEGLAKKR